jgi:beta-mannosidase
LNTKKLTWERWVVSSGMEELKASVEVRFISITSGKDLTVALNGSTEVVKGELDNMNTETHVLAARVWANRKLVSRDAD